MPKLSKADQVVRVFQNEARRRKEVALARIREVEADEKPRAEPRFRVAPRAATVLYHSPDGSLAPRL